MAQGGYAMVNEQSEQKLYWRQCPFVLTNTLTGLGVFDKKKENK